jgi:DNA-binding transcriptional LysR family regulator
MELRHLRYFVALAETLNFHRAAERLHMAQPPLTVAIRKLEQELGAPLFIRGTRGVTLTDAGRGALNLARETLGNADKFKSAVREVLAGERGRLRIGYIGSATFELIPRIIPEYRRLYPGVDLILEEATSTDVVRAIARKDLDVGLVRVPLMEAAPVQTHIIDNDEFHVAVNEDSAIAKMPMIALEQLKDQNFITQSPVSVLHPATLAACHDAGFIPHVAQEATQLSAIFALVRSGLGVALVPARAARALPPSVRLIPLEKPVVIESACVTARHCDAAVVRNFVAIASQGQGAC